MDPLGVLVTLTVLACITPVVIWMIACYIVARHPDRIYPPEDIDYE